MTRDARLSALTVAAYPRFLEEAEEGALAAPPGRKKSPADAGLRCSAFGAQRKSSAAARKPQLNPLVSPKIGFAFCDESNFWPAAHATPRHGRRALSLRHHRPEPAGLVRGRRT